MSTLAFGVAHPVQLPFLVAPPPGRAWSFYISGSSGGDKLSRRVLNAEGLEEIGVFRGLFAQQSDQVEAGRPASIATPLGELRVGEAPSGAKNP